MNTYKLFTPIIFLLVVLGCNQIQKVTDVVTNPTAREYYERNFDKGDSSLAHWKKAFTKAQRDSIIVTLPYSESGIFSSGGLQVLSYDVQLQEGENVFVTVDKQPDSVQVFIELFKKQDDSLAPVSLLKSSEPNSKELSYKVERYGVYKITVQPELNRSVPFQLKIYTKPTYAFPVSGAGNKNVQSLWAASRDGGKRSHEGVDIFAPKGTPLLAVTDGRIASAQEKGRGGKQVWLRDGLFGKTIYYAHLDSISVSAGQRVRIGDTVGFVGNTGNAKTTDPHLHFGIYKGASGPVNPYPYIKKTEIPETAPRIDWTYANVLKNGTTLHQGPSAALREIVTLSKNDTVSVLGLHGAWLHVVARDSVKGFVQRAHFAALPSN